MKPSGIQSVAKAFRIIDLFVSHRSPMSLKEIAAATGYSPSTAYATMSTMREFSAITQLPDGRYYLGEKMFECGCAVSSRWQLVKMSPPYLKRLSEQVKMSSFISALDSDVVINCEQYVSHQGYGITPQLGIRLPLHATSQGKLLLAHMSDSERSRCLSQAALQPYTPDTITDRAVLGNQLRQIRAQGYAVERNEYRMGLQSVSAPIYRYDGTVRYVIGVVGSQNNDGDLPAIAQHVCSAAGQIAASVGY